MVVRPLLPAGRPDQIEVLGAAVENFAGTDDTPALPVERRDEVLANLVGAVAAYLVQSGFEAYTVAGGTYAWQRAGHPVETGLS